MKTRALIIGIAVLLLAVWPALAEETNIWDDLGKTIFDCKDTIVKHLHLSDVETYQIEISVWHKSKTRPPMVEFDAENESLIVNGKRCRREK